MFKSLPAPNIAELLSPQVILPPIVTLPVNAPPDKGILVAILLVTVVEKLASSPIAAANSLRVLRAPGAESTKLLTAVVT